MTQRGAAVVGLTPVLGVLSGLCPCATLVWSRASWYVCVVYVETGESTTGTITDALFLIMGMTPFCTSGIRDPRPCPRRKSGGKTKLCRICWCRFIVGVSFRETATRATGRRGTRV